MQIVPPETNPNPPLRKLIRWVVYGAVIGLVVGAFGWWISGEEDWFFAVLAGAILGVWAADIVLRPPVIW